MWTIQDVSSAKLWDIFCKVIDNHGDIGVCWRLAADLAARGQRVRIWVDQPSALAWMAPGAWEGHWPNIQVRVWDQQPDRAMLAGLQPADVWVEGFGCELPLELLEHRFSPSGSRPVANGTGPVWINLEYLTAETFAERSHGLPSPVMQGPASGRTRFFFYPGFSVRTGGLLREPDLAERIQRFDRTSWLVSHGVSCNGGRLFSLFCYEPPALALLVKRLRMGPEPAQLLVTQGRAQTAVRHWLAGEGLESTGSSSTSGALSISFLPALAQADFDHLLWACDLNFVRGEDSLVRAIWAGKPFVWQIYPQHDSAHHAKLRAFLDVMDAPQSLRKFHWAWNGLVEDSLPLPDLSAWAQAALKARDRLRRQSDLTSRLLEFVDTVRAGPDFQMEKR